MKHFNKMIPASPEVQEKQGYLLSRVGSTEVIQTKDSIKIQAQYRSHLDSESRGDLSTQLFF
jgi:hypothetical protein